MAPKMGKVDIDYQALHDAFFRYQARTHTRTLAHTRTHARSHTLARAQIYRARARARAASGQPFLMHALRPHARAR